MDYKEWNTAIAAHFFNESRAGEKVFLHVDAVLIDALAGQKDGVSDFVLAIQAGPTELTHSNANYCRKGLRLRDDWRAADAAGYPPYIAYLAAFVLGASVEGHYQNEGYYKRLHRLLGEEATNVPPRNFYETKALWDDLKQWANEDHTGSLGIVRCEFAGYTPYVNLPRAQIVLSEQERSRLPNLFAEVDADPHAPPSSQEMLRIALDYGTGRLEAKTLRRLRGNGDSELASLTIEAMLEELRYWDFTVGNTSGGSKEFHLLRINLQITDQLSGRAVSNLVVKDSEGFPDDGLSLEIAGQSTKYELNGFDGSWSNPLKDANGSQISAASFPWESGLRLSQGKFTVRMPARSVRVFRRGEFEGLNGLIEFNRLDPHQEFYVAASSIAQFRVDAWGKTAGTNWLRVPLRSGLPNGWALYHAEKANPFIAAPQEFSVLNGDQSVRIILEGGLKVKPAGRCYLNFAPPLVRFEGLTQTMTVRINGENLAAEAGDIVHRFPATFACGPTEIEIIENGDSKCSSTFETIDANSLPWRQLNVLSSTLANGLVVENPGENPFACGAHVSNFNPPPILLGLSTVCDLIGRKIGQVQGGLKNGPPDWAPVWLIERGRGRRKVIFCGGDPAACLPVIDKLANRKNIKEWKKILWYDRKHLIGPSRGALAELWMHYREAAENV